MSRWTSHFLRLVSQKSIKSFCFCVFLNLAIYIHNQKSIDIIIENISMSQIEVCRIPYPRLLPHHMFYFVTLKYSFYVFSLDMGKQPKSPLHCQGACRREAERWMILPEASGVALGFSGKARVTTGPACTLRGWKGWDQQTSHSLEHSLQSWEWVVCCFLFKFLST